MMALVPGNPKAVKQHFNLCRWVARGACLGLAGLGRELARGGRGARGGVLRRRPASPSAAPAVGGATQNVEFSPALGSTPQRPLHHF